MQRGQRLLYDRQVKLERLREQGIEPYPTHFRRTHTTAEVPRLLLAHEAAGERAAPPVVSVAGRLVQMRTMGKLSFASIQDGDGRLQLLLERERLETSYGLLDNVDYGDFLGAEGTIARTRRGEPSVAVASLTILAKAMRPPPEKFHGLTDRETRYRQRYLDLIANRAAVEVLRARSRIVQAIRSYLDGKGFWEVETPILVPIAAGALASPFATHHHALHRKLYLRIATELYLKRLIIGGIDKVYEIGRVFRNEGVDQDHNPEFTLLESYEAYADYQDVMGMVEGLVRAVAEEAVGTSVVRRDGRPIDFHPPWARQSLRKAIFEHAHIDIEDYPDAESLAERMREDGIAVSREGSRGMLIDKLVGSTVEPQLWQPTFLVDYPVEMSPLAKARGDDPRYAERFEAFAGGMEIANAFTELNDPAEQRERLEEQESLHQRYQGEEMDRIDEDFLLALEYGMPPTGGLGIGIDRLVMLLTEQANIRDVVLFPQVRTLS